LLYFVGTTGMYNSTLNSNSTFRDTVVNLYGVEIYNFVQNSLETILSLEDELFNLNSKLEDAKNVNFLYIARDINTLKAKIADTFFDTQNKLINSLFTMEFDKIKTLEDIQAFREKLYDFKYIMGYSDNYTYFDDFYRNTMSSLETLTDILESGRTIEEYKRANSALITKNKNYSFIGFIRMLFKKLIGLISGKERHKSKGTVNSG
jgi:hypothetical protein